MSMPIRITKPDGCVLTVSSWAAWKALHAVHTRGPCKGCDGEGRQYWLIEGSEQTEDRWFADVCGACGGKGFRARPVL